MRCLALSIDLEADYGVGGTFSHTNELEKLLLLLEEYNAKATFFVSTEIVENGLTKKILKSILKRGHEIASHGHCHQRIENFSSRELLLDLLKSKEILEKALDSSIHGHRSPYLSSHKEYQKCLDEAGYSYSSSDGCLWPSHKNIKFWRKSRASIVPISSLAIFLPLSLTYLRVLYPLSQFLPNSSGSLFLHIHEFGSHDLAKKGLFHKVLSINSGEKAYNILKKFLEKKSLNFKFVTCNEYYEYQSE